MTLIGSVGTLVAYLPKGLEVRGDRDSRWLSGRSETPDYQPRLGDCGPIQQKRHTVGT